MPHSFAVETSRANAFHAVFMQKPISRLCQCEKAPRKRRGRQLNVNPHRLAFPAWVSIHERVPREDGDGFRQPRLHVHMHLYVHRDWLMLYKTAHHLMTADAYIHNTVTNG